MIVGWVGDVEEGQEWLDMVRGLAEVQLDTVEQSEYSLQSIRRLTPEILT